MVTLYFTVCKRSV